MGRKHPPGRSNTQESLGAASQGGEGRKFRRPPVRSTTYESLLSPHTYRGSLAYPLQRKATSTPQDEEVEEDDNKVHTGEERIMRGSVYQHHCTNTT
jgi:hypothetical protein